MTRRLLTLLLSVALATTAVTTAPARANEDVAKVLAGIAGIYILKKAIDNRNDKKRDRVTRHSTTRDDRHIRQGGHTVSRDRLRRNRVKSAPQRCLRNQWTHRGTRQVYAAGCMRRHATQHALPAACLRHARSNDGPARFYTPRCLRDYGWRA